MARRSRRAETGHTILVVDDQADTTESVRTLLEHEGHRVITAPSGSEGLEVLQRNDVHVVIVDYFMPRMTGAQFVERVRSVDPYVQIILQTGYAGENPPRTLLAALDIQGYHDKTDGPERLLLWVDVALKAHHMITELRERERLQSEIVANCSHEFRTPLNIISGYAELMRAGDFGALPEAAFEPLTSITDATRTLLELVTDFLGYAKVEAGVSESLSQRIDVPVLAAEIQRLGEVLLEDKDVRFALDLTRAPTTVDADPVKLRTILRNLVGNAAKFTAEGEIVLAIEREGDATRFAVRDTGCGIRAEDLPVIFEPFRQADGSMTRRYGGVGLGLALARKMARLLGGDLEVESQVDVGSTFAFLLPVAPATDATLDQTPAARASGTIG
ncbi:MAG: hybrid sensor histidine kinase/response regulator [Candidatus Binatia bacterium]